MLEVDGLLKRWTRADGAVVTAVDHLRLRVAGGEVYGLLGPNGAGKTTTLRMLCTLLRPDAGSIRIDGVDPLTHPLEARRRLGFVPAESGLPERLSAREVVRLFAEIQSVAEPKKKADHLLDLLGATAWADRLCGDLSTGMKRRVVLARALVHDPRVLLLDEPTDGLDVQGRRDVLRLVRAQAAAGRAVIVSSHIMGEVERVVDRIGVMAAGKLVDEGTVSDVVRRSGASSLDDAFLRLTEAGA